MVAWFDGRAEYGPRALGSRSLMIDPRNATLGEILNRVVKKREAFRPFAPSVLEEEAPQWFEDVPFDGSPYMSMTLQAKVIGWEVYSHSSSRLQMAPNDSQRLPTAPYGYKHTCWLPMTPTDFHLLPPHEAYSPTILPGLNHGSDPI